MMSADRGNSHGQYNYDRCLERGIGVATDPAEAAKYYKLSANQHNSDGQSNYGCCLERGIGVPADPIEAAKYYKLSADNGNSTDQNNSGRCLERGLGVQINLPDLAVHEPFDQKVLSERGTQLSVVPGNHD
jgi:TPR repeat protein